jgi:hypothetical protein
LPGPKYLYTKKLENVKIIWLEKNVKSGIMEIQAVTRPGM